MKPSEVLLEARERIVPPASWIQQWYARSAKGRDVQPESRVAVCYCMVGATMAAAKHDDELEGEAEHYAQMAVREMTGGSRMTVPEFNDAPGRTQLECVVALEKAALLAMSEGQ